MCFFGTAMKFQFIKVTLHALISELIKSLDDLNPEFICSYFVFKNITDNKRKGPLLRLPGAKWICYGINSVFRAGLHWNSLPQSVKYSESILKLKMKIKNLGNID